VCPQSSERTSSSVLASVAACNNAVSRSISCTERTLRLCLAGRLLERSLVRAVVDQLNHREPKLELAIQIIVHESVRPPIGVLVAQYCQAHDRAMVPVTNPVVASFQGLSRSSGSLRCAGIGALYPTSKPRSSQAAESRESRADYRLTLLSRRLRARARFTNGLFDYYTSARPGVAAGDGYVGRGLFHLIVGETWRSWGRAILFDGAIQSRYLARWRL
jgi:hypothetical protein